MLPTVILDGSIPLPRGGQIRWFLWSPWLLSAWRRPMVEDLGEGHYRWKFGPFDGKVRKGKPRRTQLWMSE